MFHFVENVLPRSSRIAEEIGVKDERRGEEAE